jgi:serine phosphatase RsbU (regulator of sigma subunit)
LDSFLDIHSGSLTKHGEQLCGDKVMVFSSPERAIVVLSDGLGSGVKANILATMTTSIIVTMLRADVSLPDVMSTVIGSLPIDRVRQTAYSTFTIVDVDKRTNAFRLINYDNPAPLLFRRGKAVEPTTRTETSSTARSRSARDRSNAATSSWRSAMVSSTPASASR